MDKQFLHPGSLISDYKLTKSASFSELSTKRKIIIEKQYQTQTHGNLIKQYSCEEIFDKKLNKSQIKVSQTLKTDNAEHVDTWEKIVPVYNPSIKSSWLDKINMQTSSQRSSLSLSRANAVNSKAIILPARLIVGQDKLNQTSKTEKINHCDDEKNSLPVIQKLECQNNDLTKSSEITNNTPTVLNNEENENHKLNTSQLKKRLRSLVAIEPKKKKKMHCGWSLMFFVLLPVAILYLAFVLSNANTPHGFCTPRFKLKQITQELERLVYDQDTAISDLAKFFNERDNQTSFDVIAFIGGIGVGKSYTAEIIKNNIKDTDKIQNFFPPLYKKEDQAYGSLSVCRCNLIRLENLKTDDIEDAARFISNLKQRAEKYCVLVIAIFNTEEVDHNLKRYIDLNRSISLIQNKFEKVNLQARMVSFTPLSNEALMKCIKDAGDYNEVKLTDDNIEYVMRDLLAAESGCKGAYAKVLLVGKK